MAINMYTVAGDCPGNEELALRIQAGDRQAAELLISQNEGYITDLALDYADHCELEDLKQEGAMALLEAAKRFAPSFGTKLLTYATPAMESVMADYGAQASLSLSIPSSRYDKLRKVAHICVEAEGESEDTIIDAVCEKLDVSSSVAAELLREYRTLFQTRQLGNDVFSISRGGDPARAYDRYIRRALLLRLMEEVLKPRELNLVRYYLGIGQPDGEGMTFQELAIRLNYNGPSGAEKAYKSTLRKLKKNLYSGSYGQWISIQKAIREARAEAEAGSDGYIPPQTTWVEEKELSERFICEVSSLIRVNEIFCEALEGEENERRN